MVRKYELKWYSSVAFALAVPLALGVALAGEPEETPQTAPSAAAQSGAEQVPPESGDQGPSTPPQTLPMRFFRQRARGSPSTQPINRREMMRQMLIERGLDPDEALRPKIRYQKGSFMITGSIQIRQENYDAEALIQGWIRRIEPLWKARLPLAAKMGNSGRVTYRGVLKREEGISRIEKIESSDLESFDEAARQALEEFQGTLELPEDFPSGLFILYLKFHYNMFSEI
ncbi:MAG: hypothetical protein V3U86_00315 [Acidobacteriota bacterium]